MLSAHTEYVLLNLYLIPTFTCVSLCEPMCSNDYDADIAKYSSEHGIFGNAIDALYGMLKGWTIFAGVTFAGSERKLKEAEKRNHVVCVQLLMPHLRLIYSRWSIPSRKCRLNLSSNPNLN